MANIETLDKYIANAEAKIEKWKRQREDIILRKNVDPHVVFAMKGFKSRFSLLSDEALAEKAWSTYTIDTEGMNRDEIIKAMLDAEFASELNGVSA